MSCHPATMSWEAAPVCSTIICFASLIGLPCSLVRRDLVEVCPLSRGVILRVCSTPIPSITEEPSLFPRSCTHTSIGFPCGSLSRYWERYGLAMFRFHARVGEVHPFPPGALTFTTGERGPP